MTGIETHRFGSLVLFVARDRMAIAHASWGERAERVPFEHAMAQKCQRVVRWRARRAEQRRRAA